MESCKESKHGRKSTLNMFWMCKLTPFKKSPEKGLPFAKREIIWTNTAVVATRAISLSNESVSKRAFALRLATGATRVSLVEVGAVSAPQGI